MSISNDVVVKVKKSTGDMLVLNISDMSNFLEMQWNELNREKKDLTIEELKQKEKEKNIVRGNDGMPMNKRQQKKKKKESHRR